MVRCVQWGMVTGTRPRPPVSTRWWALAMSWSAKRSPTSTVRAPAAAAAVRSRTAWRRAWPAKSSLPSRRRLSVLDVSYSYLRQFTPNVLAAIERESIREATLEGQGVSWSSGNKRRGAT